MQPPERQDDCEILRGLAFVLLWDRLILKYMVSFCPVNLLRVLLAGNHMMILILTPMYTRPNSNSNKFLVNDEVTVSNITSSTVCDYLAKRPVPVFRYLDT